MYATKPAILPLLAACGLAVLAPSPPPAQAAEIFAYRLLPGKSTLRYSILAGDEYREIFAGVSGTFAFTLNDDKTIAATAFDLTIEGPFTDGALEPPDIIPFAAGNKLADYLAVNFADVDGFQYKPLTLNGVPAPPAAVVGPEVANLGDLVSVGRSYYYVTDLNRDSTILNFESLVRPELGGSFQLFPAFTEVGDEPIGGPGGNLGGDVVVPRIVPVPNIVRIPEPAAAQLLSAALPWLFRRRLR